MNILYGKPPQEVFDNYLVLELDTFDVNNQLMTAYCVVEPNKIISHMGSLNSHKELHENLIKNYKKGDFNFCTKAIRHLKGKFSGELDSFYEQLEIRMGALEDIELDNWTSVVSK